MNKFVPPTEEKVRALCETRGYPDYTEPQATANDFLTHHTTNGWVRGRHHTPIKSWEGALTTWHRIEERIQSEVVHRPENRFYEPLSQSGPTTPPVPEEPMTEAQERRAGPFHDIIKPPTP